MFVSIRAESVSLRVQRTRTVQWSSRPEVAWMSSFDKATDSWIFGSSTFLPRKAHRLPEGLPEKGCGHQPRERIFPQPPQRGAERPSRAGSGKRAQLLGQKGGICKLPRHRTGAQRALPSPRAPSAWSGVPLRSPGQVSWECPFSPPTQQSLQFSNRCLFRSSEVQALAGCGAESRGQRCGGGTPAGKCQHQHERLVCSPGRCSPRGVAAWPVHLRGAAHFPPSGVFVPSQILLGFSH